MTENVHPIGSGSISNNRFLQEVYRNAAPGQLMWTLSMTYARRSWIGAIGQPPSEDPGQDNFFCVSTLSPGATRRSAEYFVAAHLVVLDDVDPNELPIPPSYVLETSPGNYQCGYLFSTPVTDKAAYIRLMNALSRAGAAKHDTSGNNLVRVVRLPVGSNSKPERVEEHGGVTRCGLLEWSPNLRYPFEQLVKLWAADDADTPREQPPTDESLKGMHPEEFRGLLNNIREGVDYHDSINRAAARMVARGAHPNDVKTTLQELMHSMPEHLRGERWQQRFDDIARSVNTAAEKFAPMEDTLPPPPENDSFKLITLEEVAVAKLHPRIILPNMLYADVRSRISAGGTGKTTLAMFEAVVLALGRELWSRWPGGPVRTAIVTREDTREILVARMREIMKAMNLSDIERLQVIQNILVVDLTNAPFRISKIIRDTVQPNLEHIDWLCDRMQAFKPDWLILDPMVSFGVGEQRVNDAEQGLVEAMRIIKSRFDCCTEGIHHSGKSNARDKTLDQYSGRGGSAMPDGSRMVCVMNPLDEAEWSRVTGQALAEGESGIVMAFPKISYAPKQEPVYILRRGYSFQQTAAIVEPTDAEREMEHDDLVFDVIFARHAAGATLTNKQLRDTHTVHLPSGISRKQVEASIERLKRDGRIQQTDGRGRGNASLLIPIDVGGGNDDEPSRFSI